VDGKETVGNSLGRAPWRRSDTEVTIGWTEGKPWEIALGELRWEGAIREWRQAGRRGNRGKWLGESSVYGSDERVDGRETVGNSMGRAPSGRSDTEATVGWMSVGKERDGSDDRVVGGETVKNGLAIGTSLGRAPFGGSEMEVTTRVDGGETVGNSLGRAPLQGSDVLRSRAVGTGFQDKFHEFDCPEKLCAQDFSSGLQTSGDGTCIALASLAGSDAKNARLLVRVFQDKFHQYDCSEKLCA